MAILNGFSEKEAASARFLQEYTEETVLAPTATTYKKIDVTWGTFRIWVYTDSEIYWTWSLTSTDVISSSNSQILPARTGKPFDVPWGKVSAPRKHRTIYFQVKRVLTGTGNVRVSVG